MNPGALWVLITSGAGGIGEYATADNALICKPTAGGICRAVRRAMGLSAAERQALIDKGEASARRFSWPAAAGRLATVYASVV